MCTGINFPTTLTILGADSILSPLNSVLQLTSLPDPHPALLLSVTIRTIEAIANTLKPMILRLTPNVPSEVDTLKTLNVLLYHVLDVVIPCLTPSEALPLRTSTLGSTSSGIDLEGHVDTLLERISALILIPLIHSFATLSHTYLDAVFIHSAAGNATTPTSAGSAKPPGHKSGKPVAASGLPSDVRGDALSLFRVVFRVLNTQLQCRIQQAPNLYLSLHTLRASLILEAIREFERISSPVPVSRPSPAPAGNTDVPVSAGSSDIDMGRPAARVKKLAMKDARWYMCTVLHIVFSETSETPSVAYAPLTVSITPEHPEAGEEEEEPSEVEAQRNTQTGASHILDQGISAALYRLVTRCKRTASISRHDETQTSKFTGIMGSDVLGQDEGSMGKEGQGPHVQPQGRVGDRRTVPNTPINQGKSGEHKAQSAIGDSSLDVGTDSAPAVGVGVNAGGRLTKGSRRAQGVESGPLGPTTRKRLEGLGDDEMIDLDEIEYGMLLGVIERYWVWSESHNF